MRKFHLTWTLLLFLALPATSAVAQYRAFRRDAVSGRFDVSEWSMNEFARALNEQGKRAEATAMLELNSEFYPQSPAINVVLGEWYRERGDKVKALERYRRVLETQPRNPVARRWVDSLSKAP